jgi:hypothetical protein
MAMTVDGDNDNDDEDFEEGCECGLSRVQELL